MKIISPYKDYYDYLSGIYGVDPKIVLDRRDHDEISTEGTVSLVICGKSYDGLFKNGKYHWGSDLEMFNEFDRAFPNKNKNKNPYDAIFIREYWEFLFKTPQKDYLDINNKLNCPIVLVQRSNKSSDTTYHKYPILQKLDFTSIITPDEIWKLLYDWLANKISEKEIENNHQTDEEKLLNKGFDKKISFRHRK